MKFQTDLLCRTRPATTHIAHLVKVSLSACSSQPLTRTDLSTFSGKYSTFRAMTCKASCQQRMRRASTGSLNKTMLRTLKNVKAKLCLGCAVTYTSVLLASASLRHRERMSPTAGPPRTRTISAVLPPSSETGSTCATLVVKLCKLPTPAAQWHANLSVEEFSPAAQQFIDSCTCNTVECCTPTEDQQSWGLHGLHVFINRLCTFRVKTEGMLTELIGCTACSMMSPRTNVVAVS